MTATADMKAPDLEPEADSSARAPRAGAAANLREPSAPPAAHRAHVARSPLQRALWIALGLLLVGLGLLGVVLPGLPTTPFLILAASCFLRSSQTLYDRLLANRVFGPTIRDFREGRGIAREVKVVALGTLWFFVAFALFWGIPERLGAVKLAVLAAALVGTLYLVRLPTREQPRAEPDERGEADP